jgi:hypothetical protein
MKEDFDTKLDRGTKYELLVMNWLVTKKGWDIKNLAAGPPQGPFQGPQLTINNQTITSPDFRGSKTEGKYKGKEYFLEIKSKSEWNLNYKTNQLTTGIDIELLNEYFRCQEITGIEAMIIFCQDDGIYFNFLDKLMTYYHHKSYKFGKKTSCGKCGGMIYWTHEHLIKIAEPEEIKC